MEGFRVIYVHHAQGTCSVFIYILDTEGDLMTTKQIFGNHKRAIEIRVNFQQFSNGSDSFSACLFNGQIEIDLFTLHVFFSKYKYDYTPEDCFSQILSFLRGHVRIIYERQGWESLETIQTKEVYYHC